MVTVTALAAAMLTVMAPSALASTAAAECTEGDRDSSVAIGDESMEEPFGSAGTVAQAEHPARVNLRYSAPSDCVWGIVDGDPGVKVWLVREPFDDPNSDGRLAIRGVQGGNENTFTSPLEVGSSRIKACAAGFSVTERRFQADEKTEGEEACTEWFSQGMASSPPPASGDSADGDESTGAAGEPSTLDIASATKADLASELLAMRKRGKITITDYSEGRSRDSADRSLTSQQLEDIAAGQPAHLSTRCGYNTPATIEPDPDFLRFLVDWGRQEHYTISVLFGQCHTSGSSSMHHKGEAVDIGCPQATSLPDSVGTKYGVSRNSETCAKHAHWHYSVGGR